MVQQNRVLRVPLWVMVGLMIVVAGRRAGAGVVVSSSSVHSDGFGAGEALDGDRGTRWASQLFDGKAQWWQVDLGKSVAIRNVILHWEAAYAVEYQVQVSGDGKNWETLHHQKQGKGGKETISGLKGEGRFLRVMCLRPGTHGLFSIWEVELPDEGPAGAIAEARRQAAEEGRRRMGRALAAVGAEEIIFAGRNLGNDGHWYANFAYYARDVQRKAYGKPGGKLYRLNLRTGECQALVDDPAGAVRDPQVHYDAGKILFSYRKGSSENFHLYEINVDGSGLRQLTDGPFDDIEPTYLPDGGIAFCSSRCKRWVNCWLTQVATIHRCDADGRNIRPLSANLEQDNTPWVLPDGRILYQRWEYVDRSQVDYHHLWTMNPDGTNQMVYFGNMHSGTVMIDAKPIAGTEKVLATFSPGHGQREHEGPFYVVDPLAGPDDQKRAVRVGSGSGRDPWPVSEEVVLYARGKAIRLTDKGGMDVELYADPKLELHEPRPLVGRARERVIPARVDLAKATGRLVLADVHIGRNMEGVRPGEIKKLLVVESLPKPINFTGGMDPLTYGGSFTLERIVGTVPVEADGSAYLELPALRSFFFVAMDEKNSSVKRMQSFLTVQPGEVTSCVGCHEQRTATMNPAANLMALRRPASRIEPIEGIPEVFDFPRDIQPILDRHCVSCHDYEKRDAAHGPRAGGVILTGDRGPMFSHSYYTLTVRKQFADGRNEARANRPPRSIGASASAIMKKLNGEHYGAKLSAHEVDMIRYWIEAGATYPGTYAALGTGMIGGYDENYQVETDEAWPASKAAAEAIGRRCASCHQNQLSLPRTLSDENGVSFWRPGWDDPRLNRSRHLVFNLSRPEQSLMLLAPLEVKSGGLGRCVKSDGKSAGVFESKGDADYQKILAMCVAGKERLGQIKRFDMAGFRPDPAYVREMQRYGILPAMMVEGQEIQVYETDRAYWRMFWYSPFGGGRGNAE